LAAPEKQGVCGEGEKMNNRTEVILEAAEIISRFPQDLRVLKEQKRIFNSYVNELIELAKIEQEKGEQNESNH
jgi:hypothetical protein